MVVQIPDMDLGKIEASGQCFRMEEGKPGHFAVIAGVWGILEPIF